MAIKITDTKHYADIAAAIRAKNGLNATYKPSEMAAAIAALEMNGDGTNTDTSSGAKITNVSVNEDSNSFVVTFDDGTAISGSAGFDSEGNPTDLYDDAGNTVVFSDGYPTGATDIEGNTVSITWG